jgi:hypothetical protein
MPSLHCVPCFRSRKGSKGRSFPYDGYRVWLRILATASGRFLDPGHSLRPVDDTLEGTPDQILQGFCLKSLRRIFDEVVQALVSGRRSRDSAIAALAHPRWYSATI